MDKIQPRLTYRGTVSQIRLHNSVSNALTDPNGIYDLNPEGISYIVLFSNIDGVTVIA